MQLAIICSSLFFLTTAKSSCNCPAEKITMARIAFESNVHFAEAFFVVVLLLLSFLLYRFCWTVKRVIALLLSFSLGYIIWESYIGYTSLDPDSVRWFVMPIKTVAAARYSEICRVWVFPLTTWRFASSFIAAIAFFLVLEAVFYFRSREERGNHSAVSKSQA